MPGPKQKSDESKRRRTVTPGFRQLPPEGFPGPAPEFPMAGAHPSEIVKWESLWQLPQASEWHRVGCYDAVALYVRVWHEIESNFDGKLLTELRQLDGKIGLSPRAMKELGWEVASPAREQQAETVRPEPDRPRLYVPPEQRAVGA